MQCNSPTHRTSKSHTESFRELHCAMEATAMLMLAGSRELSILATPRAVSAKWYTFAVMKMDAYPDRYRHTCKFRPYIRGTDQGHTR